MTILCPINCPDFFISRAGEDKNAAILIDEILRHAGYSTFIEDNDFGHTAFMERMDEAFRMVENGTRIVALLSRSYQNKAHCEVEARYPLIDDPSNTKQRLIVLRIEKCTPIGFLKPIPYVDLVPFLNDAEGFARTVLEAVKPESGPSSADFVALYRHSPKQIVHPEIRAVPGFVFRDTELLELDSILWTTSGYANSSGSNAVFAAVKGLGGVGKSVLAQEYAWRNRTRYKGVWWVRAETHETIIDDLVELGARFIDRLREVSDRKYAAQVTLDHINQSEIGEPWLIVYDNVSDPGIIDKLSPADNAHIVITTRWSVWDDRAVELPIDVFSRDSAVKYLLARARRADEFAAGQLADSLGNLPLALSHARSYCWSLHLGFEQYTEMLPELIRRAPRGAAYPEPVFATFELALGRAVERCPEAEWIMGIVTFLAPDQIPLDLISDSVLSVIQLNDAVAALCEMSLLSLETLDDYSPCISVHRLVQEVMRSRLGDAADDSKALAIRLVADAYPSGDVGPHDVRAWPKCQRLESHVLAVLEDAPSDSDQEQITAYLLNQYAVHLASRGEYATAEPLYTRALFLRETKLGRDHSSVASTLINLGALLSTTNRLDDAEPLYRRALKIYESIYGSRHSSVATCLANLGELLVKKERFDEAEQVFRRALEIDEESFGSEHPNVASDLANLAGLLTDIKRHDEAEILSRHALAIYEENLGPEHPNVASGLTNLAWILKNADRFAEAEPHYCRALKIYEANFGADHPYVASALNNLANLLSHTNGKDKAQELYRRALAIRMSVFGPNHPSTIDVREKLDCPPVDAA